MIHLTHINLGSGKDFRHDYLNIDSNPLWHPDLVADISCGLSGAVRTERHGSFIITPGTYQEILANDVLEHIPDLVAAMTNCLALLRIGGVMKITVPYDLSLGAWSDPTHVRAFNERSWIYYTDWFWYFGWKTHRFILKDLRYAMAPGVEFCPEALRSPRCVDAMYVELEKVELSEEEKKAAEQYYAR